MFSKMTNSMAGVDKGKPVYLLQAEDGKQLLYLLSERRNIIHSQRTIRLGAIT